jgi:predicted metal-dependent hydrolase
LDGAAPSPRGVIVKSDADDRRDVFIEIVTLGTYAKVTAIDSVTGTEVSVTCPANAPRASMEAAAINKLEYVLKKNAPE